jgi:cytochrome c556
VLPEPFFALQDAVRAQARALVAASAAHDRRRLSDAFAGLTDRCLACHDVYLRGDAP